MALPKKTLLVCGSTGAQGSAVVRAALSSGLAVRVLLRHGTPNPFGDAVEVARGDYDDESSLLSAVSGAGAVYLVLPTAGEYAKRHHWACNVIDASVQAGAGMLVFNTSSVGADAATGVAEIDSKMEVERHLQDAEIPSVILRTTMYMGNLKGPWIASSIVHKGVLAMPLPADQPVSWISWEEAAGYAVAAVHAPGLAMRKPILQTGGNRALSGAEVADIIGGVLGKPIRYVQLPVPEFEAGLSAAFGAEAANNIARFYDWVMDPLNANPLEVDLHPLRAVLPAPQVDFVAWAKQVPWLDLA